MKYNKLQFNKTNDKKIMRKVKKNWVVLTLSMFTAVGINYAFSTYNNKASADETAVSNVNNKINSSTNSMNSSSSANINNASDGSSNKNVKSSASDDSSTSDSNRIVSDKSNNNSANSSASDDSSTNNTKSVASNSSNISNVKNSTADNSSISNAKSVVSSNSNTSNAKSNVSDDSSTNNTKSVASDNSNTSLSKDTSANVTTSNNDSDKELSGSTTLSVNSNEILSLSDNSSKSLLDSNINNVSLLSSDNSSYQIQKAEFNHISRYIHFQATTGKNGYDSVDVPTGLLPNDVNSSVDYIRYKVLDSSGNLIGYSSDGKNDDISVNDPNQGWVLRYPNQANNIPDVNVPDLSSKGFEANTNKVSSTYDVTNGFSNANNNSNVDKIKNNYYTADGDPTYTTVEGPTNNLNSYEHVTITYNYVRSKVYNTSNFYRQIDYVSKNDNDGVQAGNHIADSRYDAINYRQIKIYQNGTFIGYSTTNNSLDVDVGTDDANQGWRLYQNPGNDSKYKWDWNNDVSPSTIPNVDSPSISGFDKPSIATVNSTYQVGEPTASGTGFTNPNDYPNVWISGQTGLPNTFEYVKVTYENQNNKVVPETKNVTRTINYVDKNKYEQNNDVANDNNKVAQSVTQTVSYTRNAVYDSNGNLLGYSSGKYGDKNPDISIQSSDSAWKSTDSSQWNSVNSPDLTSKGYNAPDKALVNDQTVTPSTPNTTIDVLYDSSRIPVGPSNPQTPGQPINPSNPDGPKWPAGTDKDSVSKTITRTIHYLDKSTNQEVSKEVTQPVTFGRTVVIDKSNGNILGYSSNNNDNVDISTTDADKAWHSDNSKWSSVTSPDLSSKGYNVPDKPKVDEVTVQPTDKDTNVDVYYNAGTIPVGPNNPQNPGQPINPNNPDGPKWPTGTDKESVSKTVTRTITYVDKTTGQEVSTPVKQTETFSRTANVDKATGKIVSYTDWTSDNQGKLSEVKSPDLSGKGYTAPDTPTVNEITVTPESNNSSVIVKYDHGTVPVGPNNPQIPGQPINPNNPDGPKWPAGTDKDSVSKTVTRTINYFDKTTGKSVASEVTQNVTFTRTAVVDKVTGKIVGYSSSNNVNSDISTNESDKAWYSSDSNWPLVKSPDLSSKGYQSPDKSEVGDVLVKPTDSNVNVNVYYDKSYTPTSNHSSSSNSSSTGFNTSSNSSSVSSSTSSSSSSANSSVSSNSNSANSSASSNSSSASSSASSNSNSTNSSNSSSVGSSASSNSNSTSTSASSNSSSASSSTSSNSNSASSSTSSNSSSTGSSASSNSSYAYSSKNKLPQTGDENESIYEILGAIVIGLSSLLALAGVKRRKK